MAAPTVSIEAARRIALAAQGFARPRPSGRIGLGHVRRVVRDLGLLQIDYVNVLAPAQYQVLFSRLGPYERSLLDRLLFERREFLEQWAHEASIVPIETWPLLAHRRDDFYRSKRFDAFKKKHGDYVDGLLAEIRLRGPLTADDFDTPAGVARHVPGAWRRSVPRIVLEHHFGFGRLVASNRRPNFMREYDLPERIVPDQHRNRKPSKDDAQRALLAHAARAQGISSAGDLADYWRMPIREARPRIAELVEAKELREVAVDGWNEPAYLHANATRPRRLDACALLSPFDPVVWTRGRLVRLYDFDYRLEIFMPKPKRRWGYYVLPFLWGDRIVARVDLKAQRADERLDVLAAYVEKDVDAGPAADALARELRTMANWLGLSQVRVERRGGFARQLAPAVRALSC